MGLNRLRLQAILSSQARKKNLPYLCEVEYLESTGTQYIDIGYKLQTTDTVKHIVTQQYAHKSATQYENHVTAPRYFGIDTNNSYTLGSGIMVSMPASLDSFDKIVFEGKPTQGILTVNDTLVASRASNVSRSLNIYIFGACGSSNELQYPCFVKKKSHQIYVNDVLIFDGIPVLDYDMKPAMYDRVTKKLFYNEGTGADFKYGLRGADGNLYTSVSYIESTGEQYINIGYRLKETDTVKHVTKHMYTKTDATQYENHINALRYFGISPYGVYTNGVSSSVLASKTTYDDIIFEGTPTTSNLVVNGQLACTRTSKVVNSLDICIFAAGNGVAVQSFCYVKKKLHQIYVNNKLKFAGIPVINANGKPAMFDIVTKKPFYNDGTGADFIVGE